MSVRETEPGDKPATADEAMYLANAGWIQRDTGWVYPDLETCAISAADALRMERGWQEHDAEVASGRRGTP